MALPAHKTEGEIRQAITILVVDDEPLICGRRRVVVGGPVRKPAAGFEDLADGFRRQSDGVASAHFASSLRRDDVKTGWKCYRSA